MKLIHKRALSLLLSTVMVLTTLPVTAMALNVGSVSYLDSNGSPSSADSVKAMRSSDTELDSGWYVVDSDVTIDQTVTVSGDANLILADGANLTINGTSGGDYAGIEVPQGCSLSIYAQSTGSSMGKLTAIGSGTGAGIGNNSTSPSGNISICGGRITAKGGGSENDAGPAIGNMSGAGFGTISFSGGIVSATCGSDYGNPDIGGLAGDGDKILIKGGTVFSTWPDSGVSLGDQYGYLEHPLQIAIDGGSVKIHSPYSCLSNSEGQSLSLVELTIPGQANAVVSSININNQRYGNSVYTDGDGSLYLSLPAYGSAVPIVVTMKDGSKYWAFDTPSGSSHNQYITLLNTEKNQIFHKSAAFDVFDPADITVYKYDPDQAFSVIRNGGTPLTKDQDYTVNGDIITIKSEYLSSLPVGVTTLTFGLGNVNASLPVTVLGAGEYMALGDSIATGYGLPDYDWESKTPPADAYVSLVANSLGRTKCSLAIDGMNSDFLIEMLASPQVNAYLTNAKSITLSIGSGDLLDEFLEIVSDKLSCTSDEVLDRLPAMKNDPAAMATLLSELNADDGTGIKNNADLNDAASDFSQNFQSIISSLKTAAPHAKIYVTNVYNPYAGLRLSYGSGTLDLGEIADGYIKTLNSAFSSSSSDYTLIDTYTAFLKGGPLLVNARLDQFNFDPHPSAAGHAIIADMILKAGGYTPTVQAVSTAIGNLTENSTPGEVANAVAQVLSLSPSEQAQLAPSQVAALERLLIRAFSSTPSVPAPDTTNFSGSSALPGAPSVTGLALATYGASGATLKTTQVSPPPGIPGGTVAFDLTLTEGGAFEQIHSVLPFPVMITIPLPPSFTQQAGFHYTIMHTLQDDSSVPLPVTISGTPGHYTATFTTSSFSKFTIVGTPDGSSSGSNTSSGSGVTAPESGVTPNTFVSDTNTDFSVNGAYQFKITSQNGIAPLLTVGTPGVFETQLVRVSGNDYYFKLISVGKAGEKAGVYINGVKLLAATVGTAAAPVKSDTAGSFKVAKGKTYTFKLTADGKPSFVCGNSSVFLVKFLRQSGKDYFYQVTAVGKPGQTAGFYLNSAKKPVAVAAVA